MDESSVFPFLVHDLRAPLTAIRSASDLLVKGEYGLLSEDVSHILSLIRSSATKQLEMIDSLFEVEHGSRKEGDVVKEIQALIQEASFLDPSKKRMFSFSHADIPSRLLCPMVILRRAVMNVLDNAVKFTDIGSVSVALSMEGERLIIVVTDTGRGVAGKNKGARASGHGLGLASVRSLLEEVGGSLFVSSEGREWGTTCRIELPCIFIDGTQGESVS